MDVIKKIKDFIVTQLSKEEITQLEQIAAPAPTPAPTPSPAPTPAPVALKEQKTKDGTKTLSYENLTEGATINDLSTGVPLPANGDFELADGTKITCKDGKIVKVEGAMPAPAPAPAPVEAAKLSAIEVQLTEEKTARELLKKEIEEISKNNKLIAATLQKILDAPIHTATPASTPKKSLEQMSNYEKLKANRGEL